MNELFYGWLAFAVVALIIEFFSGTLYGLSFSLSGFIIAAYVLASGETNLTIVQALLFALTGAAFCFLFPHWFNKKGGEFKQGLDVHVGKNFVLKKSGEDFKVVIDGVDYLVNSECVTAGFAPKAKVTLVSHDSGMLNVALIK